MGAWGIFAESMIESRVLGQAPVSHGVPLVSLIPGDRSRPHIHVYGGAAPSPTSKWESGDANSALSSSAPAFAVGSSVVR